MLEINNNEDGGAYYSSRVQKLLWGTIECLKAFMRIANDPNDKEAQRKAEQILEGREPGDDPDEMEDLLKFYNRYSALGKEAFAKHIVAESEFLHHRFTYDCWEDDTV